MAMVRCTICGAVFDAALTRCPVCGQGPDFFVPVVEEDSGTPAQATQRRFVVLGGGPAGVSAAEALRARDTTAQITLLTDEDVHPYNRPMLTKTLDADDAALPVHPAGWYSGQHIDVRFGQTVQALDAQKKTVTLAGGETIPYDKCVYALGAFGFVPPLPGADLPEVSPIRRVADIRRIRALLDSQGIPVVVIGGGVLGLEAAWALRRLGCDVTVVELAPRVMARQLDEAASAWLTGMAAAAGIRVLTGVATEAIEGDGHVTAVRLTDGTQIPARVVILSLGVRANVSVAQAAGAAVGRGVRVNSRMETSLVDVYAAGDCAEIDGPNAQLWPVAAEMGRIAGINAAGGDERYVPGSFAVTFHGMDTMLYADGDVGFDVGKTYRIEVDLDEAAHTMARRYYLDDALCGVILLGDISQAGEYAGRLHP